MTEGKTVIKSGDYALIITEDNDIEFLMPAEQEIASNKPVPKLAIALIAIANKLSDPSWVEMVISDFFDNQNYLKK